MIYLKQENIEKLKDLGFQEDRSEYYILLTHSTDRSKDENIKRRLIIDKETLEVSLYIDNEPKLCSIHEFQAELEDDYDDEPYYVSVIRADDYYEYSLVDVYVDLDVVYEVFSMCERR